jgi:hypothetical protein
MMKTVIAPMGLNIGGADDPSPWVGDSPSPLAKTEYCTFKEDISANPRSQRSYVLND